MIKRIAALMVSVILVFALAMPVVYAAGAPGKLKLESTSPADGSKIAAQNVMIKLNFNNSVYDSKTQSANKNMFKFTDSKGKNVKYKIYYDESDHNKISVLAEKDLKVDQKYTFTINGNLIDDEGNTLGADEVIKFSTKGNSGGKVYALLMLAMVVVMIVITVRDSKKAKKEEDDDTVDNYQKNPYKLAKEKGISVEEAKKIIAKDREKAEKKAEKNRQRKQAEYEAKLAEEEARRNIHRVSGKRVIKRNK